MYVIKEQNINIVKAEMKLQNTKWHEEKLNESKVHLQDQNKIKLVNTSV